MIFKKYSPIGELGTFATQYADSLAKNSGHPICITDKDTVIAVSGVPKKDFNEKRISSELEKVMDDKSAIFVKPSDDKKLSVVDGVEKYLAGVVVPIISEGDSIGTVVFFGDDNQVPELSEVEDKLAKTAATFLGSQMEE